MLGSLCHGEIQTIRIAYMLTLFSWDAATYCEFQNKLCQWQVEFGHYAECATDALLDRD